MKNLKEILKIKQFLLEYCKRNDLWVEIKEAHKPELKDVILTISMKVKQTK